MGQPNKSFLNHGAYRKKNMISAESENSKDTITSESFSNSRSRPKIIYTKTVIAYCFKIIRIHWLIAYRIQIHILPIIHMFRILVFPKLTRIYFSTTSSFIPPDSRTLSLLASWKSFPQTFQRPWRNF